MKVKDLIEELKKVDQEAEVFIEYGCYETDHFYCDIHPVIGLDLEEHGDGVIKFTY